MILIDSILMDEAIIHEHFSCDVQACKGACCTLKGGEGAPLDKREIPFIKEAIPSVLSYLDEESIQILNDESWIGGTPDEPFVQCIDDADCVFVFREKGIAKCGLEKAFLKSKPHLGSHCHVICFQFVFEISVVIISVINHSKNANRQLSMAKNNRVWLYTRCVKP